MKSFIALVLVTLCLLHSCSSAWSPPILSLLDLHARHNITKEDASVSVSQDEGLLPSDLMNALNFLDIGSSPVCSWDTKPENPIVTQIVVKPNLWAFAEHVLISDQPAPEIDQLLVQKESMGFRANREEITVADGLSRSNCTGSAITVKPLCTTEDQLDGYAIKKGFSIKKEGIFAAIIKRTGEGTLAIGAIGSPHLGVAIYSKSGPYYHRHLISSADHVDFVDLHVDYIVVVAPRETLEYIKLPVSSSLSTLAAMIYEEKPDLVSVSRIAYKNLSEKARKYQKPTLTNLLGPLTNRKQFALKPRVLNRTTSVSNAGGIESPSFDKENVSVSLPLATVAVAPVMISVTPPMIPATAPMTPKRVLRELDPNSPSWIPAKFLKH